MEMATIATRYVQNPMIDFFYDEFFVRMTEFFSPNPENQVSQQTNQGNK